MGSLRREVGFWGSLGRLKISELLSVELIASIVLGLAFGIPLSLVADAADRVEIAADFLVIVGALLGVVFAGMALVAGIMSGAYLRLLADSSAGLPGFFGPFVIALGTQVATLFLCVTYRASALFWVDCIERTLFCILSVLFVASSLEIIVLARSVVMHAMTRAKLDKVIEMEVARQKGDRE
jgi:hypothetical protein